MVFHSARCIWYSNLGTPYIDTSASFVTGWIRAGLPKGIHVSER